MYFENSPIHSDYIWYDDSRYLPFYELFQFHLIKKIHNFKMLLKQKISHKDSIGDGTVRNEEAGHGFYI